MDERRNGPGREYAPHLKGSEVCQGRGGGARGARRVTTTEAPSSPAGALPAVQGRRARRFPTTLSGWRRSSSAPSSSSPTSYPWCRFWRLLGRGIRWWRCCRCSTCWLSSKSSQCPRSFWTRSPSVLPFVVRRRQNSWWKCRRTQDIHWQSLPCRPLG